MDSSYGMGIDVAENVQYGEAQYGEARRSFLVVKEEAVKHNRLSWRVAILGGFYRYD